MTPVDPLQDLDTWPDDPRRLGRVFCKMKLGKEVIEARVSGSGAGDVFIGVYVDGDLVAFVFSDSAAAVSLSYGYWVVAGPLNGSERIARALVGDRVVPVLEDDGAWLCVAEGELGTECVVEMVTNGKATWRRVRFG